MLFSLLLISLAGSIIAFPLSHVFGRRWAGWLLALLPAGLFAAFVSFAGEMEAGRVVVQSVPWAPLLGVDFALRLDGFSLLFALLITGIGAFVVIYAGTYMTDESDTDRARFFSLLLQFMTVMLGAVLSDNLVVMFVFWEATSIISFLLIGYDADSPHSRRAALMSLRITAGGGLAFLAAIILIGQVLGTYSMSEAVARAPELAQSPWIVLITGGVFIGAFTKSAQFPFYFWLPNAMQAPTPASAYLHSATMVKLGIYLLARFEPVIDATARGRDVLVGVALATMIVGSLQAVRAEHFKSVLAYSTIASLGILVLMVGLDGPAATVAMVGFILAHALYKATLFFCAGAVIHATGLSKLRSMGGLVRYLPITAAASLLASLSMAGLPPFLGFISKEFLFEAQIESSWSAIPMAIAVIVNATIVGVAGVVTLRPFFLGEGRIKSVKHGEKTGLLVGPVILALLGLVISLEPGWISRSVLRPAVQAVYGSPVEVDVGLWHGVTPMLALSAVVVGVGALLFVYWREIHDHLRSRPLLDRFNAERGYEILLRRQDALARWLAGVVQHGDLRLYLWVVIASAGSFIVWGAVAGGHLPRLPVAESFADLRAGPALVALVGLAGGLAATRMRSLLATMIAVGLAGLVTALTFMMSGAPDLALTQFAVESLVVVLLTLVLLVLPMKSSESRRTARQRRWDAILAATMALIMFVVLLDMSMGDPPTLLADFYAAQSYESAFGRNVVNVILVDFRGFDTLGETTVVTLAAVFAWAQLGPRSKYQRHLYIEHGGAPFILAFTSRLFFWLLAALSVVILLRGHNEIGGGFVGGLTAALAFAMVALAKGVERTRELLRVHPLLVAGAGLALAVAAGLPGLLVHGTFLQHIWTDTYILGVHVKQGTTLIFDLGVYLAVFGSVVAFLLGLQREAAR